MQNKRKYFWIIILGVMFIFLLKENLKFDDETIDYNELVEQNISFEGFKLGMTLIEFEEIYDIDSERFYVEHRDGTLIYDREKMIEYSFSSHNEDSYLFGITTYNPLHEVLGITIGDALSDAHLKLSEISPYDEKDGHYYFIGDYGVGLNRCFAAEIGLETTSDLIVECITVTLIVEIIDPLLPN